MTVEEINDMCRHYNLLLKHYGYNYTWSHWDIGNDVARLILYFTKKGIHFELERYRYNSPIHSFTVGTQKYVVDNPVDFRKRYEL